MPIGHVRRAAIEDAPDIAAVHVRSWQGAYAGLLPQEYLDQLDPADRLELWQAATREADWPRSGVLAAGLDGGICGFCAFGPMRDADGDPEQVGEVYAIYLQPQAVRAASRSTVTGGRCAACSTRPNSSRTRLRPPDTSPEGQEPAPKEGSRRSEALR
jgi:hypothetical protein